MTKNKVTSLGEYIRELRENAELPLRKVAAQLDIDPSLLAKYERNERQPSKELITQIAKIFNVDEKQLHKEYISDQIVYKIIEEDADIDALKVVENKFAYLMRQK